ncbi:MAG: glycosyltransferase, partial [Candidatus Omnitrophica bacterium]|nr:glycosyltransferase [Candidatus Omnitrophota bacterium]
MNILYLVNHLNIGGITSYSLTLSRGLIHRGHRVYVASSGTGLLSEFIKEGAFYIHIPIDTKQEVGPKIILSMFKLLPVIKKNNIDILHSNSRTTQVLGSLLSVFTGTPHVSTCHGFFKKRFFRRIFPCWGAKTIAISEPV